MGTTTSAVKGAIPCSAVRPAGFGAVTRMAIGENAVETKHPSIPMTMRMMDSQMAGLRSLPTTSYSNMLSS